MGNIIKKEKDRAVAIICDICRETNTPIQYAVQIENDEVTYFPVSTLPKIPWKFVDIVNQNFFMIIKNIDGYAVPVVKIRPKKLGENIMVMSYRHLSGKFPHGTLIETLPGTYILSAQRGGFSCYIMYFKAFS